MALIILGVNENADAATLKASYRLQGNLISEVAGAPELSSIGVANGFALEAVDGGSRQVLTFPRGGGLSLNTVGLVNPNNHSVAMQFRLSELSEFRRILDFSNGTADEGLYNLDGRVQLYGGGSGPSPNVVFNSGYARLVLTNALGAGGSQETIVYVNGVAVTAANTFQGFDLGAGVLRFFADNTSGPFTGEESAGAVACIQVYDGALTPAEVGQVSAGPTLCPPLAQRLPTAQVTGRLQARKAGQSIVVDTGLVVSCPTETEPCVADGQVDLAPTHRRATAASARRLGAVGFSVSPGESTSVVVRLYRGGAKALRKAGRLRIQASAEIFAAGKLATAQQTGVIEAPDAIVFRPGAYTGTTSQGLPILVRVSRKAIRSVYFRWRVKCEDGKTHTSAVFLQGEKVRRGRFSFSRGLETGGTVHVAGRVRGARASGSLSRSGPSSFGTKCTTKKISWHARASDVETEA